MSIVKMASPQSFSLQPALDELRQRHGAVGTSVGILRDGQIETAASGVLNLNTGVEVTSDSVFQIGSVSKIFTATLIMQLVDEGRLSLDVPVRSYLPEFQIADKQAEQSITPRMLLNHLSGMEGDFFPPDDPEGPSTRSYVRKMRELSQLMAPGEEPMAYCNSGFMVAGRLIEILTDLCWEEAVLQRICQPLGMAQAFTRPRESLRYRCAMGHINHPENLREFILSPGTYLPLSAAAAGTVLSMSVGDLLLFAQMHLADGLSRDGKRLLSVESTRAMREPQTRLPAFSLPEFNAWGLGWMLGDFEQYQSCGHDGGTLGQFSYLRLFPEHGTAMAMLMNSPHPDMFLEFIDQSMMRELGFKRPPEPIASPESFDPQAYLGTYDCLSARHRVELRDGELILGIDDKILGTPSVEARLLNHGRDVFQLETEHPRYQGLKLRFFGDAGQGRRLFSRISVRSLRRHQK